MKNKFKWIKVFIMLAVTGLLLNGCNYGEDPVSPSSNTQYQSNISGHEYYDLIAGQNILVGKVEVWNDGTNLYVNYNITPGSGWCLTETHMHAATNWEDIPQKNGNPIPGRFAYKHEGLNCASSDSYTILLTDINSNWQCDDEIYVATHAVVDIQCQQTGIVYGMAVDDNSNSTGEIWEVDVINQTASHVFTSTLAQLSNNSTPNGLAYDGVNNRVYYCNYKTTAPKDLFFWDGTIEKNAGTLLLDNSTAPAQNAAADFYNGNYYYILSLPASDDLYEVTFDPDGTILSQGKIADISNDVHAWEFYGDIAIKDGILYGWGKNKLVSPNRYEFFQYDLSLGTFSYVVTAYTNSLQLAFGSDGKLYGHDYYSGAFRTIDISNGAVSPIISIDPSVKYTDCASGMICEPETETAWGKGPGFPGNNWAMYFMYTITCPCDEWVIYGSNLGTGTGSDALYKIDLNAKTRTLIHDPGAIASSQNYPNANAYDPVNQRVYFGTDDGRLFYYDIDDAVQQLVATGFGTMACGAWYDGNYYYVQNNTNKLYKVTITGTTASRSQIGTVPTSNGYGDIVFDPHNPGVFVGSAGSNAYWYAFDINNNDSWTLQNGGLGNHKQLAYGSDGVLYGVEATSGQFYTVEYSIEGTPSVTLTPFWNSGYPFTDLASGPQCQ